MSRYAGWRNYETSCAHLWISNEKPTYRYWTARARECLDEEDPLSALEQRLKGEFTDRSPRLDGMWGDLLTSAFEEIDWREIAAALIEESTP